MSQQSQGGAEIKIFGFLRFRLGFLRPGPAGRRRRRRRGEGGRGERGERQTALHDDRLRLLPRHGRTGRRSHRRAASCANADPFAAFLNQLRHPANEMPPYVAAVLSDADAGDIFAYVKSLPPPADMNSISILKDLGG
jgi:hypothetical protein